MGLFFFVFHLFPRNTGKRGMERGVFPLSLFFVFIEVCCFVFSSNCTDLSLRSSSAPARPAPHDRLLPPAPPRPPWGCPRCPGPCFLSRGKEFGFSHCTNSPRDGRAPRRRGELWRVQDLLKPQTEASPDKKSK